MLSGCCQSVRPWSSFLGCGQLSVRSRSCEPCYHLLLVYKRQCGAVGVHFRRRRQLSIHMGSFASLYRRSLCVPC
jgi:hypothetical protein